MRAPCGMIASGDGWPPNNCGGGLNTPMTLYGTAWMWMRWPIGSIRSNSSSASFWLTTTTWAEAASSTSVKERPGETSPPATLGHAALRPKMRTLCWVLAPNVMSACPPSSRATQLTRGRRAMTWASATEIGGLWRQGLISSEPSEITTPPEKKRPTQNVFGPDCSSMSATPLLKPLTIAPITITTMTPIATPRIVSAARALWARSDSSAMPTPSSSGVTGSLLAQGGDRVEPSRAARGVHPGDDPHAAPHDHAEHDRERRDGGRERADGLQQHRQPDAGDDPEGRAYRRQGGRFGEELAQDVAPARPQRLPDPDLPGPLGHGHQHDVHDDDAAHDERDPHEAGPDGVEDAAQLVPEVEHAFRRFHREVVILARAQVPPAAHDGFGLIHRFPHLGLGVRLHDEGVDHAGRVDFALDGGEGGRHDELVERDAEQVPLALHHPDHPVGEAVDAHAVPDRVHVRKQLVRQVIPEHDDRDTGLRLLGGERAAVGDLQVHDVEVPLGRSLQRDILGDLAVVLDAAAVLGVPRRHHRDRQMLRHRVRVRELDAGAPAPRPPHRVLDVEVHVRRAAQVERVHAHQRARELLGHVAIHPVHDRPGADQERDADEDADRREHALQLLRPDHLEREPDRLEEGHPTPLAAGPWRSRRRAA